MAYLLSALKSQADISIAFEAQQDPDWPGGLAYVVVEQLLGTSQPVDEVTEVELYNKLLAVKMKKKEDPRMLFEQVATIQNWYNNGTKKIPREQMLAVILRAAPDEYASVITSVQQKQGTNLQVSDVRIAMNKYYRTVYGRRSGNGKDKEDDEVQLAQPSRGRGRNGKGKFPGTCNTCGKRGHKAADCWHDAKNADKRPAWYKQKEVSAAAASKSGAASKGDSEISSKEIQLVNLSGGPYADQFEDDDFDPEGGISDDICPPSQNIESVNRETQNECGTKTETMLRAVVKNRNGGTSLLYDPEIFVLDTGATAHSTGYSQGLVNTRDAGGTKTQVGNGETMATKLIADLPFSTKNGINGKLNNIHLMAGAPFNLISGTKLLKMGYKMTGDENSIVYQKYGYKITFDEKIHTPLRRSAQEVGGVAAADKTVSITEVHKQLGHMDEAMTRKTAAELGWKITRGSLKPCESCAINKAKQKKVCSKHEPNEKHQDVNGRVYLDQSRMVNPNANDQPVRPYWTILVDEKTSFKTTIFTPTKNGMVEPVCRLMGQWKNNQQEVKTIRMDNAGENKLLVKTLNSVNWKMYPTIEYTARDTPQHNHLAEIGFATLYGRSRALMHEAYVPANMRHIVAQKAVQTATKLDSLIPVTVNGVLKSRAEHFSGERPKIANHLRKWGEAGTVKTKTATTPKLEERGITCMFVGYAEAHSGDTYEMLNFATRRVIYTRDVIWLGRMYFDKEETEETVTTDFDVYGKEREERKTKTPPPPTNERQQVEATQPEEAPDTEGFKTVTRSGRVSRPNPRYMETNTTMIDNQEVMEIMAVGAGIGGGFTHTSELKPMKYDEAMSGPKAKYWDKAVDEEHDRMLNHAVFKVVPRTEVPKFAKILSSTWAMKQKANGTFRARLNARGFEQRAGEHYDETSISSPVVNEASIFIILTLIIMAEMWAELNDVKGAFLNGVFSQGEKLYMHIPQGFEKHYQNDVVLLLLKTIYGLKQSAFEYWKALLNALKTVGLTRSKADPCVYFRWTDRGINIWASWVDDLLSCGHKDDVDKGRETIKKIFDLDEVGELSEYVGCKIEYNKNEGSMKLTQPVLIQSFEDEFDLSGVGKCNTPASPGTVLVSGAAKLDDAAHHNYRKGVGKLIHLAKYSRPTILNAVRELSRFGSSPTMAHEKALLKCLKHCVDTKDRGLILKPNKTWNGSKDFEFEITGESDSNFATDPETRKSVSGWTTKLNGSPYVRKSKTQKFVTLSVTEAECVAATSCVQDMLFCKKAAGIDGFESETAHGSLHG